MDEKMSELKANLGVTMKLRKETLAQCLELRREKEKQVKHAVSIASVVKEAVAMQYARVLGKEVEE